MLKMNLSKQHQKLSLFFAFIFVYILIPFIASSQSLPSEVFNNVVCGPFCNNNLHYNKTSKIEKLSSYLQFNPNSPIQFYHEKRGDLLVKSDVNNNDGIKDKTIYLNNGNSIVLPSHTESNHRIIGYSIESIKNRRKQEIFTYEEQGSKSEYQVELRPGNKTKVMQISIDQPKAAMEFNFTDENLGIKNIHSIGSLLLGVDKVTSKLKLFKFNSAKEKKFNEIETDTIFNRRINNTGKISKFSINGNAIFTQKVEESLDFLLIQDLTGKIYLFRYNGNTNSSMFNEVELIIDYEALNLNNDFIVGFTYYTTEQEGPLLILILNKKGIVIINSKGEANNPKTSYSNFLDCAIVGNELYFIIGDHGMGSFDLTKQDFTQFIFKHPYLKKFDTPYTNPFMPENTLFLGVLVDNLVNKSVDKSVNNTENLNKEMEYLIEFMIEPRKKGQKISVYRAFTAKFSSDFPRFANKLLHHHSFFYLYEKTTSSLVVINRHIAGESISSGVMKIPIAVNNSTFTEENEMVIFLDEDKEDDHLNHNINNRNSTNRSNFIGLISNDRIIYSREAFIREPRLDVAGYDDSTGKYEVNLHAYAECGENEFKKASEQFFNVMYSRVFRRCRWSVVYTLSGKNATSYTDEYYELIIFLWAFTILAMICLYNKYLRKRSTQVEDYEHIRKYDSTTDI